MSQDNSAQPTPQIERQRRWAKDQLAHGLPEDEQVRILWAMTLGWRTAMSGEMAEPFMRTGAILFFPMVQTAVSTGFATLYDRKIF